jgi:hypothetical protein
MEILCVIVLSLLLIVGCRWFSRFFGQLAAEKARRDESERFYKEALLVSVQGIERSVTPDASEEMDAVERLLRANKELIDKDAVKTAIEQELGIQM